MSGTVLLIMCVVIVAVLAAWLVAVAYAQRRPWVRHPGIERRRGRVQGATHTGGGRSVAPPRDAVVVPGENPEDSSVPDRGAARGDSPMDL